MNIIITAIENQDSYLVKCEFFTDEAGYVETTELVEPEDLGAYLYERLPYKGKADIFSNIKAVK